MIHSMRNSIHHHDDDDGAVAVVDDGLHYDVGPNDINQFRLNVELEAVADLVPVRSFVAAVAVVVEDVAEVGVPVAMEVVSIDAMRLDDDR